MDESQCVLSRRSIKLFRKSLVVRTFVLLPFLLLTGSNNMLHLALFCQDASKNIHLLIPEIPCKTGHSGAKQGETNNDKNTIYMPRQCLMDAVKA